MKTFVLTKKDIKERWIIVDATDQILGRLASRVAFNLRGKHLPTFTPHLACGDHIIIINGDKIKLTGNKINQKIYTRHTGRIGSFKEITIKRAIEKDSTFPLRKAIERMMNNTPLRKVLMRRLYIYNGNEHPHHGQQPIKVTLC